MENEIRTIRYQRQLPNEEASRLIGSDDLQRPSGNDGLYGLFVRGIERPSWARLHDRKNPEGYPETETVISILVGETVYTGIARRVAKEGRFDEGKNAVVVEVHLGVKQPSDELEARLRDYGFNPID